MISFCLSSFINIRKLIFHQIILNLVTFQVISEKIYRNLTHLAKIFCLKYFIRETGEMAEQLKSLTVYLKYPFNFYFKLLSCFDRTVASR